MDQIVFPVAEDKDSEKYSIVAGDQIIILLPWSQLLTIDEDLVTKKIRNCRLDNIDLAEMLINELGGSAGNICILIARIVRSEHAQLTYTRLRTPVDRESGSVSTDSFDFDSCCGYDTSFRSQAQISEIKEDFEASSLDATTRSDPDTASLFDESSLLASSLVGAKGSDFYHGYKSSSSDEYLSRRRHCLLM